jgi:hypothetical protein
MKVYLINELGTVKNIKIKRTWRSAHGEYYTDVSSLSELFES